MSRLFQPLLFLFAKCSRNDLIRQIEFLKAENELLRKRVPQKLIILKPEERSRLLKLGKAIGPKLRHLLTIVRYNTFLNWARNEKKDHQPGKRGRKRTAEETRELILRLARENDWGYTRIMGEIKKLGLTPPSRSTVKNILREHQIDPGPKRGPESWSEFLQRHAETLWQCDFFSKKIWTKSGLRQHFVMVFLHLGSRRVFVTNCTRKPNTAWMKKQAEEFTKHVTAAGLKAEIVQRDRDRNYKPSFDQVLKDAGIRVKPNSPRSPNLQAHIERWVQSIKQELLERFIIFGEKHFNYLVSEYVEHYHTERPHQAKGNRPLTGEWPEPEDGKLPGGEIVCRQRLGGLLKHYERKAA